MKKKLFIISLAVLIVLGTLAFLPKSRAAGLGVGAKSCEVKHYDAHMCLGDQKQYKITLWLDVMDGQIYAYLTFKNRDMFDSVIKMLNDPRAKKVIWNQEEQKLSFLGLTVGE